MARFGEAAASVAPEASPSALPPSAASSSVVTTTAATSTIATSTSGPATTSAAPRSTRPTSPTPASGLSAAPSSTGRPSATAVTPARSPSLLNGTWWLSSYTLPGHSTVSVPKNQQTVALTISGAGIRTDICQSGKIGLRGDQVVISWFGGASGPRSCPPSRLLTPDLQRVATRTVDYTVDRVNLTFTRPGFGTLVFVSDCYGPSMTPTSGVMQPMYITCRTRQQGQTDRTK